MANPTDQSYLDEVEQVFASIEDALDASGLDVDPARHGGVLEIEFDDGSRVILNAQAPLHEIWLASRAGGRHFRQASDGQWLDTRSTESLATQLSAALSLHAGAPVVIALTARPPGLP